MGKDECDFLIWHRPDSEFMDPKHYLEMELMGKKELEIAKTKIKMKL